MIVGNFPLALFELSHWQKLLKGKAHYLANKCLAKEVKSYILLSYYDSGSVKEKKKCFDKNPGSYMQEKCNPELKIIVNYI